MALNFDPGAYLAAFQGQQNREQQNRAGLQQALQSIPQGIDSISNYQQLQKQDRYNQLKQGDADVTAGYSPETINARTEFLRTGKLPIASNSLSQSNPNQSSIPNQSSMNAMPTLMPNIQPQRPGMDQMASAGTPDTGFGEARAMPSPTIQKWNSMGQNHGFMPGMHGPNGPIQSQSMQPQSMSLQNPQGLFDKNPFDVNAVISQLQKGDASAIANLNDKQMKQLEATPAYAELKRKQEPSVPISHALAIFPHLKGQEATLNKEFPSGIPEKYLSYLSSGLKTDQTIGTKESNQQDKLEQQARQSVTNLRGDKSLARAEEQRDAAIVAYNRIQEIEKQGGELNPIDYTDILGQIYKARTGAAPTEQVLNEIRQATAKGQFGKAFTYMTGKQAPATTLDITKSLKDMAMSMGQQADKFHEGYMKSHLIKPKGLEDGRWQPILTTGRGQSFQEATGNGGEMSGGEQSNQISSQQEYDALPSGSSYIWNGVQHRKK